MHQLVTFLFTFIQLQTQIIELLFLMLVGKNFTPKADPQIDKKYHKLSVDPLPILGPLPITKIYDYDKLLLDYKLKYNKDLKPIKYRGKNIPPANLTCHYCGAPHGYFYDNNGGKGQYLCKVCNSTFFPFNPSKDTVIHCPFCHCALEKIKERKDFDVFKCTSMNCSFYKKNIRLMSPEQKKLFAKEPYRFKHHYIFRKFHFDFIPLSKENPALPKVDLSSIKVSHHVLGLILTYHINYGIPSRKTAALMYDVHGVKISHQSILNYTRAIAPIVKPFVDGFEYSLSDSFCGDETYIKVNGRWHYIFFFFDAVKKIILSYNVSKHRDTLNAIKAIDSVLSKLKTLPDNLNLITDGNPIYLLAQQFFAQHNINFDVTQVIGLSNEDPVSKEFRPLKQIIERLNRTFKGNYKATTGYGSEPGSVANVTLFVAYFNFLRPHSKLDGNVPVVIPKLNSLEHMPAKWLTLIKMSEEYIKSKQPA